MERQVKAVKMRKEIKRNWRYDLLRVISMILVMLFHYTSQFSSKYYDPGFAIAFPQRCATFGISVFLVLIGFFSYKSSCNENLSPWRYIIKRAQRLLPTFWLCLIITSIVICVSRFDTITVKQFALNFFLINRFVNVPFIDGAYWYMLIVVVFSVFVFVAKCLKKHKYRTLLYVVYTVMYVLCGCVNCFVRSLPTILSFVLFDYLNKCLIGLILAYLLTNKGKLNKNCKNLWGGVLCIILLLAGEFFWMAPDKAAVEIAAVIVVTFVAFYGNRLHCNDRLSFAISLVAGESYFVYLIHQQIGYVILKSLIDAGSNCNAAVAVAFLIVALLSIGHYAGEKALKRSCRKKCT